MSNLSDLKDALVAAAADIGNAIDRLDCLSTIDDWYACRQAVASVQAGGISSYSIAGRSITRQNIGDFQRNERELWYRIQAYLYRRGIGLVDLRDTVDYQSGVVA